MPPEAGEAIPMRLMPLLDKWNVVAGAPAMMLDCRGTQPEHYLRLRIGVASSDTGAACRPHIDPAKVLA